MSTTAASVEQGGDTGLPCLMLMLRYDGVSTHPARARHRAEGSAWSRPANTIASSVIAASQQRGVFFSVASVLCLLPFLFASHAGPAAADSVRFDPAACHPNVGALVHVALGRSVFRWPDRELTLIGDSQRSEDATLVPPNPQAPQGCQDNPIRGASFAFAYRYQAVLDNKHDPALSDAAPDLLQLIQLGPSEKFQLQGRAKFEATCSHSSTQSELANGMSGCMVRPQDPAIPEKLWARSYQAPPAVYAAPFDQAFYVNCSGGIVLECAVDYKLSADVMVLYRFRPERIPLDKIIDFDRALRAKIFGAEVHDYPWGRRAD